MLRSLLRGLGLTLAGLVVLAVAYGMWSAWAYRDLAPDEVLTRYGGDNVHRVELEGQALYYRLDGPSVGSAPVVLLVHSHYFDSRMFDSWTQILQQDFTVVRFDMTSHGLTGPDITNDYSMARSLWLMEGLLSHLGVSTVAVVGSSLGGNMAFHWAAQYPERVSHLVLANSGGLKREQNSKRSAAGIAPWFYRVFYFVPEVAYRKFLQWMIVDDTRVDDGLVDRFHTMFRREGNRQAEMERMRTFDVGNPDLVLASVTAPTLLLWGEDNPQLPAALVGDFRQRLSAAERVRSIVYPDVGHVLPLESPYQAANDILDFLQD